MTEPPVTPRRFLFVLWEGGGTVTPTLGLAKRLVERGHSVRVISDSCNEAEVKAAGCSFTPYSRAPNRTDKAAASSLIANDEVTNRISVMRANFKVFLDPGYAQDVLAELSARPVDVCVVNDLLMGALFAPEKACIPTVVLMPQRLYSRIPPPGKSLREKFSVAIQEFLFQRIFLPQAFADMQTTRRLLGLLPLRSFFAYYHNLPRILIMSSRAFDYKARPAPNMRYIGPMLDDPVWAETWESPWPTDHPDPLVVVALSTTYQKQEAFLQKVMDAIADLPVRALVTLGPSLDHAQFRIPAQVVVRPSVPHGQVFPQAAAIVTHCGHGTVMRALSCGVPMVCIPFGGDQDGNARRVVAKGAGVQLDRNANVLAIREAIQHVIHDPTFRQHAIALGSIISEDARTSTGVQELEQLAEGGN